MKRFVAVGIPILSINLGMGLARYISLNPEKEKEYFISAIYIFSVIWIILSPIVFLFAETISKYLFGDKLYYVLVFPMFFFLYACSFQNLCFGYFRGKREFNKMNFINIIFWILAIIPLLYLFFDSNSDEIFILTYFMTYSFLSIIFNSFYIIKSMGFKIFKNILLINPIKYLYKLKETKFLKYGINRLPAGFFFSTIFFIPIFVASSSISLKAAAIIGIVISVVRMLEALVLPISVLLLPKFSNLLAQNNLGLIKKNSQIILEYIFTIPMLIGLLLYLFSNEIILIWFSERYKSVIPYLDFIGPFIGVSLAYFVIRGILDGLYDFPYTNYINLLGMIATLTFSVFSYFYSWGEFGLTLALTIGISLLGLVSIYILILKLKLKLINKEIVLSILWIVILFLGTYLFKNMFIINNMFISLIYKFIVALFVVLLSSFFYYKLKLAWIDILLVKFKS